MHQIKTYICSGRLCLCTDNIQQCGFSCTVRADEKVDTVTFYLYIHIGQCLKSVKDYRNILYFQYSIFRKAPIAAPISVPLPPIATQITMVME